MELTTARAILGVTTDDEWSVVRAAYRARIRRSHPDVAGTGGVDRSVQLNAAYRALAVARREGRLHEAGPPPRPRPRPQPRPQPRATGRDDDVAAPSRPADDVRFVDRDTLALSSPPEETFRRLVEATHAIGDLSYVDRSASIFEAVLQLDDGRHASFVVSLQWRAHDASCEAFCTLEALDRAEHLDVSGVLEQLVPFIPPDRGADAAT